jgi:FixJ family two-component response regulator
MNNLSGRERQVAELIYSGSTNRAISLELDISEKTVEKYRANAMEKLGSDCIAAMIRTMVLARLGAGIAP